MEGAFEGLYLQGSRGYGGAVQGVLHTSAQSKTPSLYFTGFYKEPEFPCVLHSTPPSRLLSAFAAGPDSLSCCPRLLLTPSGLSQASRCTSTRAQTAARCTASGSRLTMLANGPLCVTTIWRWATFRTLSPSTLAVCPASPPQCLTSPSCPCSSPSTVPRYAVWELPSLSACSSACCHVTAHPPTHRL